MVKVTNAVINVQNKTVTYATEEANLSLENPPVIKDRFQELINLLKNKNIITEDDANDL